jgi:hypothetical protein
MKAKAPKKLALSRESLRRLDTSVLARVAGASGVDTNCQFCSAEGTCINCTGNNCTRFTCDATDINCLTLEGC